MSIERCTKICNSLSAIVSSNRLYCKNAWHTIDIDVRTAIAIISIRRAYLCFTEKKTHDVQPQISSSDH